MVDLALLITCTRCRRGLPAAAFFLEKRSRVEKRASKGLTAPYRGVCKECSHQQYEDRKRADPARFLYFRVKYRAKQDGIEFSLQPSDVFLPSHCPILGIELAPVWAPNGDPAKPTLDRLVPSLGYVPGNVAVISNRANRLKGDASLADLERIAAWMRAHGVK